MSTKNFKPLDVVRERCIEILEAASRTLPSSDVTNVSDLITVLDKVTQAPSGPAFNEAIAVVNRPSITSLLTTPLANVLFETLHSGRVDYLIGQLNTAAPSTSKGKKE